jgi:hypothetical protein
LPGDLFRKMPLLGSQRSRFERCRRNAASTNRTPCLNKETNEKMARPKGVESSESFASLIS